MSDKSHGGKGAGAGHNDTQGRKKSKDAGLYFLIAAGVLGLCWYYVTAWAPLQIDPKHSQDCLLYQGVEWVVASASHKVLFGIFLALPLVIGLKLKAWKVAYFRLVSVLALVAVAIAAWDLGSPGDYFTAFVNRLLEMNFFDRS